MAEGIQKLVLPTRQFRAQVSLALYLAQLSLPPWQRLHIRLSCLASRYKMSHHSDSIEPSLHKTATNITLSPELFEKLYLTPKVPHVGDAYKRYANPTPMGFVGFVISTFSFAMVMMGWGGAAGLSGVAGIFFFVGPVLLLLGTIFEWIMGNFFPVSASCSEGEGVWCPICVAVISSGFA
jgi:hypothetical protein